MKQNGNETIQALAEIDTLPQDLLDLDPEVELPQTAHAAAVMVDWLGLKALGTLPQYASTLQKLPKPKDNEHVVDYTTRTLNGLKLEIRGIVLDLGLAKVLTMGKVATTGIQVRVWRAYQGGEWQYSPHCPDTFYEWVKLVLASEADGSLAEVSKLANLCEAIAYLIYNGIDTDLPQDTESIFRSPLYRRYKAILPKLRALIEDHQNADNTDLVEEAMQELIGNVGDESVTAEELDERGRKSTSMPSLVFIEAAKKDPDTEQYIVTGKLTRAQRNYFQRKLGRALDYRLEGENYDTEDWMLSEYRQYQGLFHFRLLADGNWTDWFPTGVDHPNQGFFDSAHKDFDIGVIYYRYWQKVEDAEEDETVQT